MEIQSTRNQLLLCGAESKLLQNTGSTFRGFSSTGFRNGELTPFPSPVCTCVCVCMCVCVRVCVYADPHRVRRGKKVKHTPPPSFPLKPPPGVIFNFHLRRLRGISEHTLTHAHSKNIHSLSIGGRRTKYGRPVGIKNPTSLMDGRVTELPTLLFSKWVKSKSKKKNKRNCPRRVSGLVMQ